MRYALDSFSMKKIDEYTIEEIKIPALVLMERAALETSRVIKNHINKTHRILVLCGPGNNGGDGIAAGRILHLQGYHVAIFFLSERDEFSPQMKIQMEIAENLGMAIEKKYKIHEYDVIIDALFGVGLARPVTGEYKEIINEVNTHKKIVFSVDIPSGISADNGKVMNVAVKANYTITYGYMMKGLLVYPGINYAGEITLADIGFPQIAEKSINLDTFYYDEEDLELLPIRQEHSHKGSYGKVLIIAGSKGMSGAAYMSAKAAYKTGAGLVKILTSTSNREILQTQLPEALFSSFEDKELVEEEINWADIIVIGPGLGVSLLTKNLLEMVIKKSKAPLIIDADGINILANKMDEEAIARGKRIEYLTKLLGKATILTPHLKELSRLLKIPLDEISDNIIDTANGCSYNNSIIYVLKDSRTIVTHNGLKYINRSGTNGMATGGSGDVLTGVIAALIGQKMDPYDATCLAVYIHGLAGQAVAKEKGTYSVMAGDIIDSIELVLKKR